jgi:L-2-hydroxycarboxylate dehydrogenase (NAD+)
MTNRTVTYEEIKAYTIEILKKLGYPEDKADITAEVLVEADARGVASHGVARLDFYEKNIKGGFADPKAEPSIVHETPLSLVVDGNNGVGSHVARFTMAKCIEKAKETGAGFGAVRNSNHFGMAGLWAEKAAAEDHSNVRQAAYIGNQSHLCGHSPGGRGSLYARHGHHHGRPRQDRGL